MSTGIQSPDLLNYFRRIQIDDLNPDLASIDPEILTPVYPVDPTWIGLDPIIAIIYATTINGVAADLRDVDADSSGFPGQDPQLANNRWYHNIRVFYAGGTVSPIITTFNYEYGTSANGLVTKSQANPSRGFYGPIFVPAGAVLNLVTETFGGAGDTINVAFYGVQASPGVPLPLIPRVTVSEYP
tara:strand:- start:273 stop:827 length:555 start_codon:yes stop_codon:yes gene_type:complete